MPDRIDAMRWPMSVDGDALSNAQAKVFADLLDVPPWLVGPYPRPRFARLRWRLRRWWKL